MDDAAVAQIIVAVFLLMTGAYNWGTELSFPWRMKDFRRFSLDWIFKKADLITIFLGLMGLLLVLQIGESDGLSAAAFFIVGAVISHILIHLRWTGELVATPQVGVGSGSRGLRSVYLSIIKRWHPDKATSTEDFFRRNHITALANKAYDANDSTSLNELNALKKGS